ncbi:MAG: DinB family protein [Actinomycetes bacterium]
MTRELQEPSAEQRTDPPYIADERTMLEAWLDFHRATLLWKCDGLSGVQLAARSVEPSTLSLLGLVRHMINVERGWFRHTLAGEEVQDEFRRGDEDGEFDDVDPVHADADLALFRSEVARCREVAARFGLDDIAARERRGQQVSARWIYVHMIEEYARHNGHADLLRERIDGVIGD